MAAWDPSAALFDSLQVLGESIPGFQCDFGAHGVGSIDLTTPFTQFNGVVTRTLRPSVEHLRKWAESYSASARPWSIQLRGHPTDEVLALAQSYGLTERHREPLMVLPVRLLPSSAPERPSAQVTCVGGEASAEYEQALTHGSGCP
ncbi:hypothetical protein [Aeromicrobium sp. UC242_57]|uniref:hypothetical protein n=1 Tax=Aeromicrobium sp. UC242_57 TaxID=3374624 RepID=UPI0037BAC5C7